jgi:hypothetical protein
MPQTTVNMPVYENEQGYIDTWGVGGDRFGFLSSSMFDPQPFVGTTNPVPEALLSIPPTYNQLGRASNAYGVGSALPSAGSSAPWNPSQSLVPWVILGLILGVWGIHSLYFKKGRK